MKSSTLVDFASASLTAAKKVKDDTDDISLVIAAFLTQRAIEPCLLYKLSVNGVHCEQAGSIGQLLGECKKYRYPELPKELEEWLGDASGMLTEWSDEAMAGRDYYVGITRLNDAMRYADRLVNEMQDYISLLPKYESAGCNKMDL